MPIKSISAMEWGGSLTAPSVGSITTKGNKKIGIPGGLYIDVDVDGVIGSVKVAEGIAGTWDCKSVKSVSALWADDFYLTLSQKPDAKILALGKMTVKEDFDWSQIISSGNIGTITAGVMWYSNIFAGVSDTSIKDENIDDVLDLPTADAANFNETATIKSIAIKGVKDDSPPYFVNSNVAATNVLSISIAYPQNGNGGEPFGITADYIKSLKVKDDVGTMSMKNLHVPADILDPPEGDAEIRLY
jgi:hypothetical protein